MPCVVFATREDELNYELRAYQEVLCKVCKSLSKREMECVRMNPISTNVFDWYVSHLIDDFSYNRHVSPDEALVAAKELHRLDCDGALDDEYRLRVSHLRAYPY